MSPQPEKMSPQQAKGLAEYLLGDFEREIPTTIRVIEAAQDGKLDYAPDAKAKTALALIRHLAMVDPWFLNSIANGAFDGTQIDETDKCGIATPAEGGAKYKEAVAAAVSRVRDMSGEKLAEEIDFFGMMKLPAVVLIGIVNKHSIHHRGQLSTYLRPMGCKCPGIYGPSADTQ
jgi:uncharacterized damage-inducible protein DinB